MNECTTVWTWVGILPSLSLLPHLHAGLSGATLGHGGPASPPMSMVQMEKIFSASVLAHTLPKPTLVRLLSAK